MRLVVRLRRGMTLATAGLTVVSGLVMGASSGTTAHADTFLTPPPVDACYSEAGFCNDVFMKAPIAPTTVTTPVSEDDTWATFTFTSPSAGINTTTPVGCGDAGCVFNHYDWNEYASFPDYQVVSGCGEDQDTCTVKIARGRDGWVGMVASLNDYPTALWLMWVPSGNLGIVQGTVSDGLGHPVAGATVTITGPNTNATGLSGSDGSYLWQVHSGHDYVVTVTDGQKDVYSPASPTIAIPNGSVVQDFALPLHTVSGKINAVSCGATCSLKGAPGVTVDVTGTTNVGTPVSVEATSTASGTWSGQAPNGTYTVKPSRGTASFTPVTRAATVTADLGGQDFQVCANALSSKDSAQTIVAADDPVLCPYGLDWTMPSKMGDDDAAHWHYAQWGIASNKEVYPTDFKADVFLTEGGAALSTCPTNTTWTWSIVSRPANSAAAKLASTTGCKVQLLTPTLGTFTLKAVERNKRTHKVITQFTPQKVIVKDWLIGAVGDSNGSGEGNPPFFNDQCNRSTASYQYKTALALENADKRSSVTFVWASCSGAQVEDLISRHYRGIDPSAGPPLPPQLTQLADRADPIDIHRTKRKYDAILTSIGVNNLSFGGVLKYCVDLTVKDRLIGATAAVPILWPSCMNVPVVPSRDSDGITTFASGSIFSKAKLPTLDSYVHGKLAQLVGEYASYKVALRKDLPTVQPAHVLMTTYPDFSTNDDGAFCGGSPFTALSNTFPPYTTDEWGWLSDMGTLLNQRVDATHGADGFTPVDGVAEAFKGHGYCARGTYIRSVLAAVTRWNLDGPFHPSRIGHEFAADVNIVKLCGVLYKNADCTSKNPNA